MRRRKRRGWRIWGRPAVVLLRRRRRRPIGVADPGAFPIDAAPAEAVDLSGGTVWAIDVADSDSPISIGAPDLGPLSGDADPTIHSGPADPLWQESAFLNMLSNAMPAGFEDYFIGG